MTDVPITRQQRLRTLIADFLHQRLSDKLDKLPDDDAKRDDLKAQYQPATWLLDAARRVGRLQLATHTSKGIHPAAKGTSLYVSAALLPVRGVVGSHCLISVANDVVGDAAALYVYKLLKLEHDGQTLLSLLQADDADVLAALSDDTEQTQALRDAFVSITEPNGGPGSHTRAKQLYWLVSPNPDDLPNPCDDSHYHLLSPLYASAFSHHIYQTIQQHRFGEEAKAARQAKRDGADHPHGYSDYPQLAEEKKGGTKPQNISQLNSERKGSNYLLASLPPVYQIQHLAYKLLKTGQTSVFKIWGEHLSVWTSKEDLLDFLNTDPPKNMHTRDQRDGKTDQIIDEIIRLASEAHQVLQPGWSDTPDCHLSEHFKLWLDPRRAEVDEAFRKEWLKLDWPLGVCQDFAYWMNEQCTKAGLPVSDPEHKHWKREMWNHQPWLNHADRQRRTLEAALKDRQKGAKDAD